MKFTEVGDETYEQMIMQHVKCMSVPEAAKIEDKIILKKTASAAGVPVTDWSAFDSAMVLAFLSPKVNGFLSSESQEHFDKRVGCIF